MKYFWADTVTLTLTSSKTSLVLQVTFVCDRMIVLCSQLSGPKVSRALSVQIAKHRESLPTILVSSRDTDSILVESALQPNLFEQQKASDGISEVATWRDKTAQALERTRIQESLSS